MKMKKIVMILASSLALVSVLAHADAPAVDDKLTFGYAPGLFFIGSSPIEYAHGYDGDGDLTALQAKKVEPIEIDVERIVKKNADSDQYVWWLVNNHNYMSLVHAFQQLYDKGVLQSNEDFDTGFVPIINNNPGSRSAGNDYLRMHNYCQTILTATREANTFPHYWVCENIRASWRKGLPDDIIKSSFMIGTSMAFKDYTLGVDLRNVDREYLFLFDEIHIGYAYLILANAAHVAKYGRPLNNANVMMIEDVRNQLVAKKNRAITAANNKAYGQKDTYQWDLPNNPFLYNELIALENVLAITGTDDVARNAMEKSIYDKSAFPLFEKASTGDKSALEELKSNANSGGPYSQYYLGKYYSDKSISSGQMSKDMTEAAIWFRKAADQGNADAQAFLGYLYIYKNYLCDLPNDILLGVQWIQKSADQRNPEAQQLMENLYATGMLKK